MNLFVWLSYFLGRASTALTLLHDATFGQFQARWIFVYFAMFYTAFETEKFHNFELKSRYKKSKHQIR